MLHFPTRARWPGIDCLSVRSHCRVKACSPLLRTYYCEASVESSIQDTQDLISYIRSLSPSTSNGKTESKRPLVQPVITPRFALSCTSELMRSLGDLMKSEPDVHIQTHLSENRTEIKETLRSFPECSSYTEVYERHGMLRDNTILAHCVWLTDEEMDVIRVYRHDTSIDSPSSPCRALRQLLLPRSSS
jgi:cytosine/adenosine deaminase-related metal-dependent hydrolase